MSAEREPQVHLRDIVRGAASFAPRLPRVAHALLTVARSDGSARVSMGAWVERNARRHRDQPALLFEEARWSWSGLNVVANQWAHAFAGLGVRSGDCVALLMDARPELVFAVVGLVKIGASAGLLNKELQGENLKHSLSIIKPRFVLVGEELVARFEAVQTDLEGSEDPLYVPDPWDGGAPSPEGGCPIGWTDLAERVRWAPPSNPVSTRRVTLDDRAFTIPTSGTTGLPKASVMSHMRWVKAADTAGRVLLDLRPGDVVYVPLPFFHNMAMSIGWGAVVASGAALLMRRSLSISAFWDDCRRHSVTVFPYIGELPRYLLSAPPDPRDGEVPVRAVVGVGMPADVWRPFARRFGIGQVFEMYSASEANTAFVNPFGIEGSVGFCPGPHALLAWDAENSQVRRDASGRGIRARRGEPGLLIARVSRRYRYDGYTDPAASEKRLLRDVFRQGDLWFDTGDLLRKLGWGHAMFVDRVGDTFRWRSENVSTLAVERVLSTANGVAGCVVYGVQVPGAPGRAGMASIVFREGTHLDPGALSAHLFSELQEPAVPVFLRVRTSLVTTETFKPRKVELRREGWDPSLVDDPLWVRLPRQRTWVPLSADLAREIRSGEILF